MRKYIENYINELNTKLTNNHEFNREEKQELKDKIVYFQHERLIHLLVTLFYALFCLIFIFLGLVHWIFLIPLFIIAIILIFYVRHYFYLEHAVQYLYQIYDKTIK